jgi:shikimate kinase
MNIFLFGFKKCGKTYFGLKVAQKLHRDFVASDHLIEQLYTAEYHQTLSYRDIVKKHGFPFFRELEKNTVSLMVQKKECVFSLGGGVVLDSENVARLQQVGTLIYLKAPKALLKTKILTGEIPHYLDPQHPSESFEKFYQERMPLYEKVPAHVIEAESKSEEEILKEILTLAEKKGRHHL